MVQLHPGPPRDFGFQISDLKTTTIPKSAIPDSQYFLGGVAQLGERLPCTQEAIGSNPFTSTTIFKALGGCYDQAERPAFQAGRPWGSAPNTSTIFNLFGKLSAG